MTFDQEESAELRRQYLRHGLRLMLIFAVLIGAVFFAFWWSGSAVQFGAARAMGRAVPTWRITGVVRSAATREPIPWAVVEDDPTGDPPLFRTDADREGAFELLTLAEPHRIRASAPGYRAEIVEVGRRWFVWQPKGAESRDIKLTPE